MSVEGINILCNTIVLASATILGLLLTLLGISSGSGSKLKSQYYYQIVVIAKLITVLFVATLLLFQMLNIPLTQADNVPAHWFPYIYWSTILLSSLLSGTLITAILMLYKTVLGIIWIMGISKKHPLAVNEKENEE
ncbi:hypothetical protein [Aequorivita aquimaris]|nr:hypothetical protein [Aequorivita aquimaris]